MISQQVFRLTISKLTNHNILSKRLLMFYETIDLFRLLQLIFSNPQNMLLWIANLSLEKWMIIIIIVIL